MRDVTPSIASGGIGSGGQLQYAPPDEVDQLIFQLLSAGESELGDLETTLRNLRFVDMLSPHHRQQQNGSGKGDTASKNRFGLNHRSKDEEEEEEDDDNVTVASQAAPVPPPPMPPMQSRGGGNRASLPNMPALPPPLVPKK